MTRSEPTIDRYRLGNKNDRNLYVDYTDGTDDHIGCVFDERFGPFVVSALNGTALVHTLENLPRIFADTRAGRSLSYRAVEDQTGISFNALRRFETGERNIDLRPVLGLIRWLNISPPIEPESRLYLPREAT